MIDDVAPDRLVFGALDQWQAWQWSQQPLVRRKWRELRYSPETEVGPASVTLWNGNASTGWYLFALDSASPSHVAAVAAPLRILVARGASVALVGEPPINFPEGFVASSGDLNDLPLRVAVSVGGHLAGGAFVKALADSNDVPHLVVQHGALTPYSPPPMGGDIVLAWSESDAQMWTAGRSGVDVSVVGSQMIWTAAQHRKDARAPENDAPPPEIVFLGQLHGAELPRRTTLDSVRQLRQETILTYRPHPAETDLLSRLQHRWWQSQGVKVSSAAVPLTEHEVPVVAHFSTGLLEAAASGVAAYGYCAQAPIWIRGFWERYGITEWGSGRETRLPITSREPAQLVADWVVDSW